MKLFSFKNTAAPGYIILNLIRACNIVCLLSCLASSVVMLVKTFVISKFFFFDATSHIITGILAIMLVITETSLFRKWFMHNWPLLSVSSGFVALGLFMLALGTLILGNLNKEATSEDSLGTSCWQLLIASGIVTSIFGLINIVANYLFRKKKLGVSARMVRAYGASAPQHAADIYANSGARGADIYNEWHDKAVLPSHSSSFTELKHANSTGSRGTTGMPPRPASTVPSYYTGDNSRSVRKQPSVVMSELGGPGARSVSPVSSRTHFPTGHSVAGNRRSVSSPTRMNYKQYEFNEADNVQKPEATHPAYRQHDTGSWV